MTATVFLLALQDIDSAVDACGHRRQRLPERSALAEVDAEIKSLTAALGRATKSATDAEAVIESLEHDNAARDTKKARLNAQLKTIISPREAEALMHEIAILDQQRSEADDRELEQLDAMEAAQTAANEATARLAAAHPRQAEARAALAAAEAAVDAEVAELAARRAEVVAGGDAALVDRYESLRKQFGGVAIARLSGTRCSACHLDQSSSAMEALKHHAGDEPLECEQCGRLLAAA